MSATTFLRRRNYAGDTCKNEEFPAATFGKTVCIFRYLGVAKNIAEIGVALQDIRESLKLIRIHFCKVDFEIPVIFDNSDKLISALRLASLSLLFVSSIQSPRNNYKLKVSKMQ